MKKAAAHPTTKSPSGKTDHFSLGSLAMDFLDTAWRIAVPVIIFAGVGILADLQVDTKPWLTLAGMVIGFIFAGVLVKRQLTAAAQRDKE